MNLPDLLADLGSAGVTLRAVGDRLGFTPRHALTPERAARLRLHRAAILGLLVDGYTPGDTEAGYVYGERLGIGDGLGMPTLPGTPAWLVAVGESMGAGCKVATYRVHYGHGSTDEGNNGGGEGERRIALCDRQGRERGP